MPIWHFNLGIDANLTKFERKLEVTNCDLQFGVVLRQEPPPLGFQRPSPIRNRQAVRRSRHFRLRQSQVTRSRRGLRPNADCPRLLDFVDSSFDSDSSCGPRKPMRPFFGGADGGDINWRMASNTLLNCRSYFISSSSSRLAKSLFEVIHCRSLTKVRMISMLTATAGSLFKTLESIAIPCSVNASGGCRIAIFAAGLEITNCDFQFSSSSWVN
jgi:hypothetical protein